MGTLIVSSSTENLQQPTLIYDASKLRENSYFMEWIPPLHQGKIIKLLQAREKRQQKNDDQDKENLPVIFCRIPYAGTQAHMVID